MRVLIHTANLGGIDTVVDPVPQQGIDGVTRVFTDVDFPPRPRAMGRRLQARIPKMFAWDLDPGYDRYVWIDGSLEMHRPDSVSWLLDQLGTRDVACFRHPWRATVREEIDFVRTKLASGSRYLQSRYEGEDLHGLEQAISRLGLLDLPLMATGALVYAPTSRVQAAFREWWGWTSRYHCIDQIQFPVAMHLGGVQLAPIDEDIYHASHLRWVGHRR